MLTQILNIHALAFTGGRYLLSLSALGVCLLPLQAQQDPVVRAVERVKNNVATLTAVFPDGHEENGFGFVTGEKDGKLYLVTAGHVIHAAGGIKATSIQVEVFNTLSLYPAKEVRWFERDDLSLLVLDAIPGYQWEKNCLGKDPQVYDKVRFIGKEKKRVSPGDGEIFSLEDPDRIGFTISTVAPGTSGAPLVGKNGIIGMVIEDANSSSVALSIPRIRALIGGANYPYFSASDSQVGTDPGDPSPNTPPSTASTDASLRQYNMVPVRGGTFTMGCTPEQGSDCYDSEKPAHQVTVSDFYIGKYEVTQKEWREVMGSDPSNFKNCDNCPVEQVSWNDVQEFLSKLNAKTGKSYRLPTEAEWEYAARGGTTSRGYKYAGSNSLDEVAWYTDNSGSKTHPVGQKKANELGLYDMSGNVWEWCADDWHGSYSGAPSTGRAWIDSPRASSRVGRGGSWFGGTRGCRVSYRTNFTPLFRDNRLGFRLAL